MSEESNAMGTIKTMNKPNSITIAVCGGHDPDPDDHYHETSWFIKINRPKFNNYNETDRAEIISHEIVSNKR